MILQTLETRGVKPPSKKHELIVYSQRQTSPKIEESNTLGCQEFKLRICSNFEEPMAQPKGTIPSKPEPNQEDLLIALRKGVRSCTQHFISKFVI